MHPLDLASLKEWFIREKRTFPWRGKSDPYAVWVSEIMLQQTRASVVVGYFEKWMKRFPTISSLANAPLQDVIKAWEGLGYYSRARNLHEGAKFLIEKHEGRLPDTQEELEEIKGLGPYTVGAILSFAFQKKAAAVDGNVLRVLSRYFLIEEDVQKSSVQKKMREMTDALLPNNEPWVVMEALIELGAQICGREPKCPLCPLRDSCLGYKSDSVYRLPFKGKKTEYFSLKRYAFVIKKDDKILVKKESQGKVMAGLYEFPYLEFTGKRRSSPFLRNYLFETLGVPVLLVRALPMVKHAFTRYKVELFPSVWEVEEESRLQDFHWIKANQVKELAFSSGHRRILQMIEGDF